MYSFARGLDFEWSGPTGTYFSHRSPRVTEDREVMLLCCYCTAPYSPSRTRSQTQRSSACAFQVPRTTSAVPIFTALPITRNAKVTLIKVVHRLDRAGKLSGHRCWRIYTLYSHTVSKTKGDAKAVHTNTLDAAADE